MGVVSAFTFGRGYGALRMALTMFDLHFEEVTPRQWQKAMACLTGGDKNVSKRRAQELFPALTITHAIADALLIAEFSRRRYQEIYGEESAVQRSTEGEVYPVTIQDTTINGVTFKNETAQRQAAGDAGHRDQAARGHRRRVR
jgi:hypothetical protein